MPAAYSLIPALSRSAGEGGAERRVRVSRYFTSAWLCAMICGAVKFTPQGGNSLVA